MYYTPYNSKIQMMTYKLRKNYSMKIILKILKLFNKIIQMAILFFSYNF